ncbi:MAG: NAD(P)-dependent oxidoreductase [Acidimicrobiales bacterium]
MARGGVVDEAALHDALVSGKAAAAGLDVFDTEPKTESPLFSLPNIVVAHLRSVHPRGPGQGRRHHRRAGQPGAGRRLRAVRRQHRRRRGGGHHEAVPPSRRAARSDVRVVRRRPAEHRLGAFRGRDRRCYDNRLATLSAIKGPLSVGATEPVSFVNANPLLAERGVTVTPVADSTSRDFVNKPDHRRW